MRLFFRVPLYWQQSLFVMFTMLFFAVLAAMLSVFAAMFLALVTVLLALFAMLFMFFTTFLMFFLHRRLRENRACQQRERNAGGGDKTLHVKSPV